jgi:hypothetical protein
MTDSSDAHATPSNSPLSPRRLVAGHADNFQGHRELGARHSKVKSGDKSPHSKTDSAPQRAPVCSSQLKLDKLVNFASIIVVDISGS